VTGPCARGSPTDLGGTHAATPRWTASARTFSKSRYGCQAENCSVCLPGSPSTPASPADLRGPHAGRGHRGVPRPARSRAERGNVRIVAVSPPPLTASESVQRFRVLAEDAARGPGRNAREVVGDRLLRFGPRAVWMRGIRRPHDAVLSEEVDHAQANMISLKRRPDLSGRPLVLLSILRPSAGWEIDTNPASDQALRLSLNHHHVTYPDLGRIALRPSSSPRPSSQAASGPSSL